MHNFQTFLALWEVRKLTNQEKILTIITAHSQRIVVGKFMDIQSLKADFLGMFAQIIMHNNKHFLAFWLDKTSHWSHLVIVRRNKPFIWGVNDMLKQTWNKFESITEKLFQSQLDFFTRQKCLHRLDQSLPAALSNPSALAYAVADQEFWKGMWMLW